MPIDEEDKKFWSEQFKSLEVNWKTVIDVAMGAAKEYGAILSF